MLATLLSTALAAAPFVPGVPIDLDPGSSSGVGGDEYDPAMLWVDPTHFMVVWVDTRFDFQVGALTNTDLFGCVLSTDGGRTDFQLALPGRQLQPQLANRPDGGVLLAFEHQPNFIEARVVRAVALDALTGAQTALFEVPGQAPSLGRDPEGDRLFLAWAAGPSSVHVRELSPETPNVDLAVTVASSAVSRTSIAVSGNDWLVAAANENATLDLFSSNGVPLVLAPTDTPGSPRRPRVARATSDTFAVSVEDGLLISSVRSYAFVDGGVSELTPVLGRANGWAVGTPSGLEALSSNASGLRLASWDTPSMFTGLISLSGRVFETVGVSDGLTRTELVWSAGSVGRRDLFLAERIGGNFSAPRRLTGQAAQGHARVSMFGDAGVVVWLTDDTVKLSELTLQPDASVAIAPAPDGGAVLGAHVNELDVAQGPNGAFIALALEDPNSVAVTFARPPYALSEATVWTSFDAGVRRVVDVRVGYSVDEDVAYTAALFGNGSVAVARGTTLVSPSVVGSNLVVRGIDLTCRPGGCLLATADLDTTRLYALSSAGAQLQHLVPTLGAPVALGYLGADPFVAGQTDAGLAWGRVVGNVTTIQEWLTPMVPVALRLAGEQRKLLLVTDLSTFPPSSHLVEVNEFDVPDAGLRVHPVWGGDVLVVGDTGLFTATRAVGGATRVAGQGFVLLDAGFDAGLDGGQGDGGQDAGPSQPTDAGASPDLVASGCGCTSLPAAWAWLVALLVVRRRARG